jgi:Arc-like DNA binding domain
MATDKIQIGLRVPDDLRAKIQEAAAARGVAVNKEISDRLERSFSEEMAISADGSAELYSILRVVAAAMDSAGPMAAIMSTLNPEAGKDWINNSLAYEQAIKAAVAVLEAFKPQTAAASHASMPDTVNTLGIEMATGILEEAATGQTRTLGSSEIARAGRLHAGLGALTGRIQRFDARKPENDPGPITIRAMHGVPATLAKATPKKGKRK